MTQNFFKILPFLLFFVIIFSGCDDEKIIEEENFITIYIDLLIMQDTTNSNQFSTDSIKTVVFQRHGITAENYQRTLEYYNSSPENWEEFFNKATSYVEKLKQEAEN